MFYRMKFDGVVGSVLDYAGYSSTNDKFAVWPAGLSSHLIKQSKNLGLDPKSGAYIGIYKYFLETPDIPNSVRKSILSAAYTCALKDHDIDLGISQKIGESLSQLDE